MDFWWSIPHWATRIGHFVARIDRTIKLWQFFDEMRVLRSLRPPRSLRLLRPLRLLRILMPGKSLSVLSESSFWFFWGQRGCWGCWGQSCYHVFWGHTGHWGFQDHLTNKLMARIPLFWCFEKKYFWTEWWNFKINSAIIQDWCCGGQGCYFQPNPGVISQMSAPQEYTDTLIIT